MKPISPATRSEHFAKLPKWFSLVEANSRPEMKCPPPLPHAHRHARLRGSATSFRSLEMMRRAMKAVHVKHRVTGSCQQPKTQPNKANSSATKHRVISRIPLTPEVGHLPTPKVDIDFFFWSLVPVFFFFWRGRSAFFCSTSPAPSQRR